MFNRDPEIVVGGLQKVYALDKWFFIDLGYSEDDISSGSSSLNFKSIQSPWLKELMKATIWRKRNSVGTATLTAYLRTIRSFEQFWLATADATSIKGINKRLIDEYFYSIKDKSNNTRMAYHAALNELFTCWDDWEVLDGGRKLLTKDMKPIDRSRSSQKVKYLDTQSQMVLLEHFKQPQDYLGRIVRILLEIGARGNEVLSLTSDCLKSDETGWYLTRRAFKTNKIHTVPISREIAGIISAQINEAKRLCKKYKVENPNKWIFIHLRGAEILKYSLRMINYRLAEFSKEIDLKDHHGQPVILSSHLFRHTVGTNLINNGVAQHHVQKFLGHESPQMTAVYAQLHDQTLRQSLKIASDKLIDIKGNIYDTIKSVANSLELEDDSTLDARWLRKNIATQTLPNGICSLPIKQSCPHANACLTCPSFRTDAQHLSTHQEQLCRTKNMIELANKQGMVRQVELNQAVATSLENIIEAING
jgi:integrase